eukprot:scaffold44847_cov71-Phaeocystis_antarctica.AAC.1
MESAEACDATGASMSTFLKWRGRVQKLQSVPLPSSLASASAHGTLMKRLDAVLQKAKPSACRITLVPLGYVERDSVILVVGSIFTPRYTLKEPLVKLVS